MQLKKKKKIINVLVMTNLHTLVDRQYVRQVQALALDMVVEQVQARATNNKRKIMNKSSF
jgi:hypothetical protein